MIVSQDSFDGSLSCPAGTEHLASIAPPPKPEPAQFGSNFPAGIAGPLRTRVVGPTRLERLTPILASAILLGLACLGLFMWLG